MASTPPTDAQVIVASLDDPRAFETIFDRHVGAISRYLRRRLPYPIADELTAEVFTVAFRARHSYDPGRPDALPWLYGIAANLLRRHGREEEQELRAYARAPVGGRVVAEPLDELLRHALEPALAQALTGLEPRDREVLLLFAWANLGYEDIAFALELPLGTVKSRLNRARSQLRAALAPQGEQAVNG